MPAVRKAKVQRKDKPKAQAWTVVHADDVTKMKYGCGRKPEWFDKAHAERLAAPADPSHRWVPLEVADLAAFGGDGVTYGALMAAKAAAGDSDL
jgi:hypothetical protein